MPDKSNIHTIYTDYYSQTQLIFTEISNISECDKKGVLKVIALKKNEYLLKEGEYCKNINYLKSGILRNFYLKEGIEVITSFAFPSDISTILRSILLNEPSHEYIQAITECDIFSISTADYQELKLKFPQVGKMDAKITQLYALMLEERLFSLKFHTAVRLSKNPKSSFEIKFQMR